MYCGMVAQITVEVVRTEVTVEVSSPTSVVVAVKVTVETGL